jgi:hypothetical protein
MGRPLNKKYFGNRNIGTTGTGDNGIGGSRVASVTLTPGNLGAYTTRPTITFSDPDLLGAGGVRATGTVTSEVLSAAISGSQTRAYPTAAGAIGFNTGGSTFTATVTSSALTNVVRASATTLGFDTTTTAMISGTSIHITGASITGTMSIGGVAIAAGQIYYVGAPTGATTATLYATYADAQAATSPLTIVAGTGVTGATFTRGVTFGTVTALTPVARGSYEALTASGAAVIAAAGVGEGLVITPTYRAKAVVMTDNGSGYTSAADALPSFTQSVAGTAVLESDGQNYSNQNPASTNENAIVAYAYHTGGSLLRGDIVRQVSTDRYKVENATSTSIAKLKATIANAAGQMNIVATDTDGKTYYVIKLTSRKATLVPAAVSRLSTSAGTIFAPDVSGVYKMVPWKFDAAATGYVQIENA